MVHLGVVAQDRLKGIVHQLIEVYPPVVSARSQLQSASAEVESANWNFYPTPSVAYERGDKQVIGTLNQDTRYFRLQQPLWTAGRLTAQQNKAQAQYRQAQSSLDEQRLLAAFRWLQLWAEFQSASMKITAYQDGENKHLGYVRQIERRTQEGFSAFSDLQLSQSRLAAVRSELRQYMATQQQARMRLEQMLGRPLSDEPVLQADANWFGQADPLAVWQKQMMPGSLEQIADRHPAVQKVLTVIDAAESDVNVMRSRNLPEIYLRGEVRRGDVTGTDKTLYLGLSSSFGAGLSNMSAVAGAQARVEAARSDVVAKRLEVMETIQTELQTYQSQMERSVHLEKTFENMRSYLQSSERQFLAGRRTWQDVMNTAREEAQILTQIADVRAQIWLAQQRLQILNAGLEAYFQSSLAVNTAP